jgi:hypothetical protein
MKVILMTTRVASLIFLLVSVVPGFASVSKPSGVRGFSAQNQFHFRSATGSQRAGRRHSSQAKAQSGEKRESASQKLIDRSRSHPQSTARPTKMRRAGSLPVNQIGFVSATQIPAGGAIAYQNPALSGDFDGDGIKDVVTIVQVGATPINSVAVTLVNGDGTFQAPVLTPAPGNNSDAFVVGDINGDGKDDVIIAHQPGSIAASASFDVLLSNGDGSFTVKNNYPITTNQLAGGVLFDVDGDGKLDAVIVDGGLPGTVWTALGNGDGTFQTPTSFALTGGRGESPVFADLNGDGFLDIAEDDAATGELTVYLATSATQYGPPTQFATSDGVNDSCSNTVGDLTGDGNPEIAAANCDDNTITIYVNNGDGTFKTGAYFSAAIAPSNNSVVGVGPLGLTIADVNGDGRGDVIATNAGARDVTVLLGNGDGTVQSANVGYATGGNPGTPALIADMNGDGLADLLVADNQYSFSYMKGYGDGTFRAAVDYYSPTGTSGEPPTGFDVATGDFNGDGFTDVVVGNFTNNDASVGITVFLSRGDGSLQPGVNYGSGGSLAFVAVADFDKDGNLDIAAVDNADGLVQIFKGVGNGTFTTGITVSTGDIDTEKIVAVDLNGDGFTDLAVANAGGGNVGVILNDQNGGFAAQIPYPLLNGSIDLVAADVNGDGKLDLLLPESACSCLAVLLGAGDGTFGAENDFLIGNSPYQIAVGDLNGDGIPDVAVTIDDFVSGLGVAVALGVGDGTFLAANSPAYPTSLQLSSPFSAFPTSIQMLDLDGDGHADLIYTNTGYSTVGVLYGVGDGTFHDPVEYPTGGGSVGLALADVNGDGAVDVVTASDSVSDATVLINTSGSQAAPDYAISANPGTATVAPGAAGTYTIAVSPRNFYNGTVTFTCGTLPAETTCSFSNPTVTANGNAQLTTTLTLTTSAPSAAALTRHSTTWLAALSGVGIFGLLLAGNWKKNGGRSRMGIILGALTLGMIVLLVGCGGSNNTTGGGTPPTDPGTPAASYTVTVTATGTAGTNGGSTAAHTVNVTLIVQ